MDQPISLVIQEDGPRAILTVTLPDDGCGLYKAWLYGPSGRYLLGTMAPEGKRLAIKRTISLDELRRSGAWPADHASAELTYAFPGADLPAGWQAAPNPATLLTDRTLGHCAMGLAGVLTRQEGQGFSLAVPYHEGTPFPLTPIFCFTSVQSLGGAGYLVFHFDGTGWPIFPNNGCVDVPY